jgi:ribosomal protein L7Ae-like RNA K-turn-binding protein
MACLRRGLKAKGVPGVLACTAPDGGAEGVREQALNGLRRMLTEHVGHAHRAGAVVPGMDRVSQALTDGEANSVVVAVDAAQRTRTEMAARAGEARLVTALTKNELGAVLGTAEVGVAAITQPRLAEKIRALAVRWNRLREENADGQG